MKKSSIITVALFVLIMLPSTVNAAAKPKKETDPEEKKEQDSFPVNRKADYFYLEGLRQKLQGNYAASADLFLKSFDLDSLGSAALVELSDLLINRFQYKEAIVYLETAIKLEPDNYWTKMTLAELYRQLRYYPQSLSIYEKIEREHPEKEEITYMLALLYTQQQNYVKAIAAWNKLENIIGQNESISVEKYNLYNQLKESSKAVEEIEKLAKEFPEETRFLIMLGDACAEQGEYKKARKLYQKVTAIEPENGEVLLSMVTLYERKGDFAKADNMYFDILNNKNINKNFKINMLNMFIARHRDKSQAAFQVQRIYNSLIQQYPEEYQLENIYAGYLAMLGNFEEAKIHFEKSLSLEKDQWSIWVYLIETANASGKQDEVKTMTEAANLLFPEVPEFYYYKGLILYNEGKKEEALQAYESSLTFMQEKDPQFKSLVYGMIADLKYLSGEKDAAFDFYEKAVTENPNNILILNNYSYHLALEKKDLDKAEEMILKSLSVASNEMTYLDTYAWVLFQQGSLSLAKLFIEKAMDNGGAENTEVLEHYGDILHKAGEVEKALEMWKKSAELGNDSEILKKKIETSTNIQQ